jgi:two-component system sensor histidine kinase DesK
LFLRGAAVNETKINIQNIRQWSFRTWLDSVMALSDFVTSSGISPRLWRLYAQAWLVCLLFPITYLVQTHLAPLQMFIAVSGLGIFIIVYTWFMWPHPLADARPPSGTVTSVISMAGLTVLVLMLSYLYESSFLWLFVGVSAVAGVALSARNAFIYVMLLTLVTLGVGIWLSGGIARTDWLHLVPLVLLVRGLGLDITGLIRLSDALRELRAARDELARRAVAEERLRLARDLHDLLGHSLSLITLKSELAGRLIGTDSSRASQEMQEVEQVARQALREVREAVAGYRQPTLLRELDAARQILEAAGIACSVERATEPLPSAADAVLAWAVREGVTNVIRHSRARQCTIRILSANSQVSAEIINDGYPESEGFVAHNRIGSGLAGLTERVTAQNGRIEAGRLLAEGQPIYRLWVTLPIANSPTLQSKGNHDQSVAG